MVMRPERIVQGGPMPDPRADHACCDRCAGGAPAARIARRRLLKAAVFRPADAAGDDAAGLLPGSERARFATSGELARAVTGTSIDGGPDFLVGVRGPGGPREPYALRPVEPDDLRPHKPARGVADRIWANIGRVSATIIERSVEGRI